MPRRIPDYAQQFVDFNFISSIGAFVFGFSQLIFVYNLIVSARRASPASDRVWEGAEGLGGPSVHRRPPQFPDAAEGRLSDGDCFRQNPWQPRGGLCC